MSYKHKLQHNYHHGAWVSHKKIGKLKLTKNGSGAKRLTSDQELDSSETTTPTCNIDRICLTYACVPFRERVQPRRATLIQANLI